MFGRAIVFSLFIHILIMATIFFDQNSSEMIKTEVVQVEIRDVIKKPINKISGNKSAKKSLLLFPKMDTMNLLSKVENNAEAPGEFSTKKQANYFNDAKTYDDSIHDIFGENGNENWSYYKEIYNRIDTNLIFDSLLAQYSHFGRVYVQFKVSDNGLLNLEDLKTDAGDAILKVHVLRAIKKSLNQPIESVKNLKFSKYTLINAEFNFRYGDYKNNFYKQSNFGRPVFVFNRVTQEKPIDKKLLSYLIAEGVLDNPFLLAERFKKFNKKKHLEAVQFDPFENYKHDAFYLM